MHFPTILLLAALAAQGDADKQPDHFDWNGHPVVVFQCDFTHYPPKANVEFMPRQRATTLLPSTGILIFG